jgi:hypothetical protein
MRATEVAYITLRIQTSFTQELVGLPAVAAVYWSSTGPASGRQIVIPETRPYTQLGRCYQIRCYCAGGLRNGGTAAAPETLSYAYKRAAPTPPAKSIVDELVEKFGPKAD